jgi:hypothetical protein
MRNLKTVECSSNIGPSDSKMSAVSQHHIIQQKRNKQASKIKEGRETKKEMWKRNL